jgi:hypothetical protein
VIDLGISVTLDGQTGSWTDAINHPSGYNPSGVTSGVKFNQLEFER